MKPFALAAFAALLVMPVESQAQPQVQAREAGQLVMENVPVTPPEVREALRRYSNARGATFRDWLADGSILISTRFGQTSQVHRVTQPGGQRTQLTFFDEPVFQAYAQPGAPGAYVLFRDVGGAEYYQGFLSNIAGGEDVVFTEPKTRNVHFVFSRDGKRMAWARVTPGSGDYDIMVMEAGRPETRRVAHEGTGAISPVAMSPDGSKLVLSRYTSIQRSQIFLLDLQSGALTELNPSKTPIAYSDPDNAPGGRAAEFTPNGAQVLILSDQGSEHARLVTYDLATKRMRTVADAGRWSIEGFDLSPDGRTLAYTVNEGGRSQLRLQDLASGRALPAPELPLGVVGNFGFSPDGRRVALTLNRAAAGADVYVWDLQANQLVRWTESELGGLDPAKMIEPELVTVRSFDRLEAPAWVYRPRTSGKAPVIIDIHGGPEGQSRPGFSATYQYWANELGAVVVVPNVRGSTGYGKTYVSLDNGMKRRDSVKDIGAILDWVATQPNLDAARVVVSGGSYGGYMTLASFADYQDRLAGAIDSVGISNWITFLTNTEGYRRDLRRAEYGDEREPKMRAFLEKDSPSTQVSKMRKPLFVIAGYNDPRVPWTEGRQIVDQVRANGGDVWWMMARDEGHGFRKKPNVDALREAETLFLKKVFGLK